MSTTEEVGNLDGEELADLLGLLANVPAKPLPLLAVAASLREGAGLALDEEPNPKELDVDFKDPKPVETAPNPPPKAEDLGDEVFALK